MDQNGSEWMHGKAAQASDKFSFLCTF